jgi:hypothetical protein
LRTLAKPFDNSQLDLSIYYRYELDEMKGFPKDLNMDYQNENKTYGGVLNYYYTYEFLTLQLLSNYENINYDVSNDEYYNISGILSVFTLDDMLKFSIFYKYGYRKIIDYSYNGLGADLKYFLTKELSFYAGYSVRDEYFLLNEQVPSIEGGLCFKYSNLFLNLKYFNNKLVNYSKWLGAPAVYQDYSSENEGLGLIVNYKFWLLLLETNTSYYFKVENHNTSEAGFGQPANLPDWQFIGGLYVNGLFFDNNLDLKTGFKFYYTGEINSSKFYWQDTRIVNPTNKLDFTLAGEIKKVAIVYFIWENLFGNEYYITPYYPMPERNIRFGLAWELFN